jgi:hypothetical protein
MDYLAFDRLRHRLWVPAGNTGSVDVIDIADERVTRIEGFPTATVQRQGTQHIVGPSAVTVAADTVYIGNRGDSSVCAVDAQSLRKGACITLTEVPDGLAYVASTKEVWVTTPRSHSIVVLSAAVPGALRVDATIRLAGVPEGFAVDDTRGVFYTNLEDADHTLAIDLRSRTVAHTWSPFCGAGGPRGLALAHALNFLLVACSDRVVVLDAGHDGQRLSALGAGDGVDNIDYVESRREIYAGGARSASLTIAQLDDHGRTTRVALVPTAAGARNAVVTDEGTAYLTDSPEGKIFVVAPVR